MITWVLYFIDICTYFFKSQNTTCSPAPLSVNDFKIMIWIIIYFIYCNRNFLSYLRNTRRKLLKRCLIEKLSWLIFGRPNPLVLDTNICTRIILVSCHRPPLLSFLFKQNINNIPNPRQYSLNKCAMCFPLIVCKYERTHYTYTVLVLRMHINVTFIQ